MFTEEDLEATPVLVGSNSEPIILDRCLTLSSCLGDVENLIVADVVHCQAAGSIACFGQWPNNIYQRSWPTGDWPTLPSNIDQLQPNFQDALAEDWTSYLATVELDSRQGEISELMINNGHVRKHYSNLVPSTVPHKLFWARYFFKVKLMKHQKICVTWIHQGSPDRPARGKASGIEAQGWGGKGTYYYIILHAI